MMIKHINHLVVFTTSAFIASLLAGMGYVLHIGHTPELRWPPVYFFLFLEYHDQFNPGYIGRAYSDRHCPVCKCDQFNYLYRHRFIYSHVNLRIGKIMTIEMIRMVYRMD